MSLQKNDSLCPPEYVRRFHGACRRGRLQEVKMLLSRRLVGINCQGEKGRTAVMEAMNTYQVKIFNYLVHQKLDVTVIDFANETALHYSCKIRESYFAETILNKFKPDINSRGWLGKTPLMYAVAFGQTQLYTILKERGADTKTVDDTHKNLLHAACLTRNSDDIVKDILSLNRIDIESRGQYGRTPLMCAVRKGFVSVVSFLIGRGANTKTIDDHKNNILHVACMSRKAKMVEYVLSLNVTGINDRGEKQRTPLMIAVHHNSIHVSKLLVSKGADIIALDARHNNILHLACLFCTYVTLVKYILSLNVSNIESRGEFGRTPLMLAVKRDCSLIIKLLNDKYNASLTTTEKNGDNVLHIACSQGHLLTVKYLFALEELKGFEKKRNKAGYTPAQLAETEGHCVIVAFLKTKK